MSDTQFSLHVSIPLNSSAICTPRWLTRVRSHEAAAESPAGKTLANTACLIASGPSWRHRPLKLSRGTGAMLPTQGPGEPIRVNNGNKVAQLVYPHLLPCRPSHPGLTVPRMLLPSRAPLPILCQLCWLYVQVSH